MPELTLADGIAVPGIVQKHAEAPEHGTYATVVLSKSLHFRVSGGFTEIGLERSTAKPITLVQYSCARHSAGIFVGAAKPDDSGNYPKQQHNIS